MKFRFKTVIPAMIVFIISANSVIFAEGEAVTPTGSTTATNVSKTDIQMDTEGYIKLLTNDNPLTVEESRNELLKIGKRAVPDIIKYLSNENVQLRYMLCEILSELRDERSIPALVKQLSDKEEVGNSIASVAARALGLIGDASVITPLLKILPTSDIELRYEAIKALGNLRAQEAIPVFISALTDTAKTDYNYFVRCAATEALGQVKAKEAVKNLMNLISDKDVEPATEKAIMYYTIKSLEKITGASFGPVMIKDDKKTQELIKSWQDWWEKNKTQYGEPATPIETPENKPKELNNTGKDK
jgi:hypothetical protein